MCRDIGTLHIFDPPASDEEIRAKRRARAEQRFAA
jgi:hypothetical protein